MYLAKIFFVYSFSVVSLFCKVKCSIEQTYSKNLKFNVICGVESWEVVKNGGEGGIKNPEIK